MNDDVSIVIITGMSGAGKTVAIQSFEDLGYFCVDNMPPQLFSKLWELVNNSTIKKIALVIDLRSSVFFDQVRSTLDNMVRQKQNVKIMFLDATDETLVARYKETRRSHPLAPEGRLMEGIERERDILEFLREKAQVVIDTTDLKPTALRKKIFKDFQESNDDQFYLELISFGFKYGVPIDADMVLDMRFIKNPFYIPELKQKTGLDKPVYDYVMEQPEAEAFYPQLKKMVETIIPNFKEQGKENLTIAIGCTGGQHRSVAMVKRLQDDLSDQYKVDVTNRDIRKARKD